MKQEQLLEKLVTRKVNSVLGSYEIMILDGQEELVPALEVALDEIYEKVINSATKEVRFLGTQKIKEQIAIKVMAHYFNECEYLKHFELKEIFDIVNSYSK